MNRVGVDSEAGNTASLLAEDQYTVGKVWVRRVVQRSKAGSTGPPRPQAISETTYWEEWSCSECKGIKPSGPGLTCQGNKQVSGRQIRSGGKARSRQGQGQGQLRVWKGSGHSLRRN